MPPRCCRTSAAHFAAAAIFLPPNTVGEPPRPQYCEVDLDVGNEREDRRSGLRDRRRSAQVPVPSAGCVFSSASSLSVR